MEILIRKIETETETKIIALDPINGSALTQIESATGTIVWSDNDDLSTEHEHPEGIFWNFFNMRELVGMLENAGYTVIVD